MGMTSIKRVITGMVVARIPAMVVKEGMVGVCRIVGISYLYVYSAKLRIFFLFDSSMFLHGLYSLRLLGAS